MPSIDTMLIQFDRFGPVILFAVAMFLAAETILRLLVDRRRSKGHINERLRVQANATDSQAAFASLLRKRGLTASGEYRLPIVAFNRLVVQSGISIPIMRLIIMMVAAGVSAGFVSYSFFRNPIIAGLCAGAVGVLVPVLGLLVLRGRRRKRLETQLPEAIDIMVRSMRAGHPLPVAISMVAKEMPDPIGSEFGLVADEATYGLELGEALRNMRMRAGQSDLAFLVVAVSVQSKTGGNLSEILSNLSAMVRERTKMRRKVHSLSSEGRVSAIVLSLMPVAIWGIVSTVSPNYYGDIGDHPLVMKAFYLSLTIWAVGAFVLYRMVNFKF